MLVWDPARPGAGPAELGRHDGRWSGGGAGRRAGGHRRGRRSGCWCGTRPVPATDPVRAGPPRYGWCGRWRCCPTGGWSPAGTTGGCWCGTRPLPAPARPSWAATKLGVARWRCWPTGGWSPAGTTGGCWCGTRPRPAPARPSWAATTVGASAVAVLPDGRVVTGGDDGRVLVWDPATRRRPGRAGPPRRPGVGGGGAA